MSLEKQVSIPISAVLGLVVTHLSLGFAYNFEALNSNSKPNELNEAFSVLFKAGTKLTLVPVLRAWFPFLRFLVSSAYNVHAIFQTKELPPPQPRDRGTEIDRARRTMSRIGKQLLRESKASIGDKGTARDLLSLLVKSNMAKDLPESQRLSDEDVLARTSLSSLLSNTTGDIPNRGPYIPRCWTRNYKVYTSIVFLHLPNTSDIVINHQYGNHMGSVRPNPKP
jgi:hypothetical protein